MNKEDYTFFAEHGYLNLGKVLNDEEVAHFLDLFDRDQTEKRYCWFQHGNQRINYDALMTTPAFDSAIRHPNILPIITELMGGPVCFSEIGARYMGPYDGEPGRHWHRDRPHLPEHPLRMEYIQVMLYLTDVDEDGHCFSLSPESIREPVIEDKEEQVRQKGIYDLHGPSGTAAVFNIAVQHTATTRVTQRERKTLQTYYGHRNHQYMSNDSVIPACFWKHHEDPEVRAFYGVLNERTHLYMDALT